MNDENVEFLLENGPCCALGTSILGISDIILPVCDYPWCTTAGLEEDNEICTLALQCIFSTFHPLVVHRFSEREVCY